MHNQHQQWLSEIESEFQVTCTSEINVEANENMYCFGLSEKAILEWGRDSIQEFLKELCSLYGKKAEGKSMVFYAWVDEMAGQLRVSAVSNSHGHLPFSAQLQNVELIELVNNVSLSCKGVGTKVEAISVWQVII